MKALSGIRRQLLQRRLRGQSTAQYLASQLQTAGITRERLTAYHIGDFYSILKEWDDRPSGDPPPSIHTSDHAISGSDVIGVIVETRNHPALPVVVENVIENLGIPIQLFHGTGNEAFILTSPIASRVANGQVIMTALGTDTLFAPQYNQLLMNIAFWDALIGRNKILIFQTDAVICPCRDYSLEAFLNYDYIGSKWPRERPVGITIDGGNGGLSLRDWALSRECIQRFEPSVWKGGEDGYFAFHLDLIGANIGRGMACAKFGTQHEFRYRSFGAHNISSLPGNELEEFLQYCPEARVTLKG